MMKKTLKRILTGLAAAMLALAVLAAALAEFATDKLYDNLIDLLFYTSNVTVKAKVDFSLNGQWFKTADVVLRQDGSRSFRQMLLTSPKQDGTELKNGYTIVTDGNALYIMDVYAAGTYRSGMSGERNSLLRRSVEAESLARLGGVLFSNADLLLGKDVVTQAGDGEYRLHLGPDVPAAANEILNQAARFAAKRYFGVDYDRINTENYNMHASSFLTVTEGVVWTMKNLSVRNADLTAKTDGNGDLQSLDGKIVLSLETQADGMKQLEIDLHLTVEDIFGTTVDPFDPNAYGVTEAGSLN